MTKRKKNYLIINVILLIIFSLSFVMGKIFENPKLMCKKCYEKYLKLKEIEQWKQKQLIQQKRTFRNWEKTALNWMSVTKSNFLFAYQERKVYIRRLSATTCTRNLSAFCTFIFPNYLDNNSIKNPVWPIWIVKKFFSNKICNKNKKKRWKKATKKVFLRNPLNGSFFKLIYFLLYIT